MPAVDQHPEDQLERQGYHDWRQHHHPHTHQHAGDDKVDHQKGDKEQKANLEGFFKFGNHEGRRNDTHRQFHLVLRHLQLGQADEQAEILLVDQKDLGLFVRLSKLQMPKDQMELPVRVVTPAFMISELKKAFQIGFLLFVPFLVIDLVVASVLMSMGMMMLPPVVVSLPFKLIFWVLIDGWHLVVGALVESFRAPIGGG